MSNPWKIIIAVVLTAGIVGAGTWYYVNMTAKNDKDSLTIENTNLQKQVDELKKIKATTETAATTATDSWKNYSNTKYGFTLTFSDIWKGYEVVESDANDDYAIKYLKIYVPTTDSNYSSLKSGFWNPLIISVYTLAKWTEYQASGDPEMATEVARNNTYVFAYSTAQAEPTDGATIFKAAGDLAKTLKATDL